MAYIYKITNDINNKIYIGKTLFDIEKRFKEHCRDSRKINNEKRPLYSAMRKYGIEHFSVELIEECGNPEEREKYWIEYYGTFKHGYNATLGGDGKAYLDYELIYATYQECKNINEVARICGVDSHSVGKVLSIYGITSQERRKNKELNLCKPVARLDKNTGEILEVFASIKEASKKYPQTNKHISAVCNGKRKSCGGYGWKYL